jgi:hypothetical protein
MVLLCINVALLVVAGTIPGVPLHTPFNANATVTAIPLPAQLNQSNGANNTIVGTLTTNLKNQTNNNPLNFIQNSLFVPLNIIWFFMTFVTGAFALNVLTIFGFPAVFVTAVQAIMLILMGRGILYYATGR